MSFERTQNIGDRSLDYGGSAFFGGLIVSRQVSLDNVSDVFEAIKTTGKELGIGGYLRDGSNGDRRFGLTQIEHNETRSLSVPSDVATEDILNDIYDSVPTIRKPITVNVQGTRILSNRHNRFKILSIGFDEASNQAILAERQSIQTIIDQYTQDTYDEELPTTRWKQNPKPHVSLAKFPAKSFNDRKIQAIGRAVNEALPETLRLERASLINPSKHTK